MRTFCLFLAIVVLTGSCSKNSVTTGDASERRTRKKVIVVAEKHIMSRLANPHKTDSENNTIIIKEGQKSFVIDPSLIFTGQIDDDQKNDAIVTVKTFQGDFQTISEQLIILGREKDFMMVAAIESDMRIISLKDRIITADVPEHTRDTPLFNCSSCWEVVKYQYHSGELERIK